MQRRSFIKGAVIWLAGMPSARRAVSDERAEEGVAASSALSTSSRGPAYMQGMVDFEVRTLTADYAPRGHETMVDAIMALGAPYAIWATRNPATHSVPNLESYSGGIGDS